MEPSVPDGTMKLLYLVFLIATPVYSLTGYDCGGGSLNITTLSLLDSMDCDIPDVEPKVEQPYIQLLQLTKFEKTTVLQCRVEVDRTVYHCGMHSHTSVTDDGRQAYIREMSYDECSDLHAKGILQIGPNKYLTNIRRNATTRLSTVLAGSLDKDGTCEGEFFSDGYGQWTKVVVQAIVKVTLATQMGTVRIKDNKMILNNGVSCELNTRSCYDEEGGYSFWQDTPMDNCEFRSFDVLYEGLVSKITQETTSIYSISSDDATFSLVRTTEKRMCGYTILRTEHPQLFIFETTRGNTFIQKAKVDIENLDIFSYINSKFVYVERHVRNQLTTLYKDIMTQKCELEKQVIRNALNIATLSPDEFAHNIMRGPGYTAIIAGEVVHIAKCIPVECVLRHTDSCYSELPITIRNSSLFLTPKSKIVVKTGTQKECNPILATMYKIEDTWYKFTPTPIDVVPPKALSPKTEMSWKYVSAGPLATSGIYKQEDLENLRDHLLFPAERPAVLNTIARGAMGHTITKNGLKLYNLLDEDSLNKIAESTGKKIWSGFITFGSASAGLLGIFIVVRIIKFIVDTIIHGYTIHDIYGWSIHLIGALWSSVTHLLTHLARKPPPENPELGTNEPHNVKPPADTESPNESSIEDLQRRLRQMHGTAIAFESKGGGVTFPREVTRDRDIFSPK